MKKKRLTIENRILIEELLKLNYKLKTISEIIGVEPSTISREIKNRRITGSGQMPICHKTEKYPYVCSACLTRTKCRKKKYYYNYKKAQENYNYKLVHSRKGIDMTIDEIEYWNDILEDRLKKKNQPILHLFNDIEFPKSIQTFYSYVHNGYFRSINDEMLSRAYSYKPRKHAEQPRAVRKDNSILKGRKLEDFNQYMIDHPNANVVEMDTVIGKAEDKNCLMTLYFRKSKLMLIFLIKKYKTQEITKIFLWLKHTLGIENFKKMFEVILTDNGWEFSKPFDIEMDHSTGEKLINVFYCDSYSSWQKGGIERNHEFIRYIIPKGLTFDNLTKKNVIDIMNNINNVSRKSLNSQTAFILFSLEYGEDITAKLYLKYIPKEDVTLSYRLIYK